MVRGMFSERRINAGETSARMDYPTFERRLLKLIFTSNAPLTPVHVAYFLDLSIAEARAYLDQLVQDGVLELDSDDGGHILYSYPQRPPLDTLPAPRPPRRRRRAEEPTALVPWSEGPGYPPF